MTRPILIVDGDRRVQQTVGSILEDEGYSVRYARNGDEALSQVEESPVVPALILLDLAVPERGGYVFVEALVARGLRPRIPLLVVSTDNAAAEQAARVAAEGYLAKPFTIQALLEQVQRLAQTDAA